MEKIEKRKYLTPETEVVRFTADIITTSGDHVVEPTPTEFFIEIEQPDNP